MRGDHIPPVRIVGAAGGFDIHDGPERPVAEISQEIEGSLRVAGDAHNLCDGAAGGVHGLTAD